MAGPVRRRLYKPERKPGRTRGVLEKHAPIGCPDASKAEISMALFAICREGNVIPGRGGAYDALKDEYTVIGKVLDGSTDPTGMHTGKVQDVTVAGEEVAAVIKLARVLNGGRMEKRKAG